MKIFESWKKDLPPFVFRLYFVTQTSLQKRRLNKKQKQKQKKKCFELENWREKRKERENLRSIYVSYSAALKNVVELNGFAVN